jgi:tetratricopeptide (TPR) repeat protein
VLVGSFALAACTPAVRGPARSELAAAQTSAIALSDALEALIEAGAASEADKVKAWELVQKLPAETAADAFGRAAIAGRLAEARGAAALITGELSLISEAERWALESKKLDPSFRDAAASRMLGSLWVLAPAELLEAGDSEEGLALLEELARTRPDLSENQLRLAEALVALHDEDAAREPLCRALAKKTELRRDDQRLLERLVHELGSGRCADTESAPQSTP